MEDRLATAYIADTLRLAVLLLKKVSAVQRAQLGKPQGGPMKAVGSGLDDDVSYPADGMARFGTVLVSDDIEFLNGFGAGRISDFVVVVLIVVDAIEDVVVGLLAIAIDVGTADLERILAMMIAVEHNRGLELGSVQLCTFQALF